eukprot:CAMPEP_0194757318 /NCGR_PEP_ID=MMETSP0323_2-20130528/10842_1 /TAXON_ID=2866 ORGANISM="Crypthecodinium cohnii, Strain Seligo" /NCGR_SAMPLE_ID=MMETSP0323_2 /ASSEMBLY_ACC=CAM_ASM_000346 /LENGTH=64 /DNA_ID=CAMNT_0039677207 /DNA_START=301 /DNA_END=495 /DNA_ORIENTATION=-
MPPPILATAAKSASATEVPAKPFGWVDDEEARGLAHARPADFGKFGVATEGKGPFVAAALGAIL